MKKVAVLIIDAQNDFCSPDGTLFVPGAVEDNERLSKWILRNKKSIDYIGCTLDSHQVVSIAHPSYWVNGDGDHPAPFTTISLDDMLTGKWRAVKQQRQALRYLEALEENDEYSHLVWPEHTLIGDVGSAIDPVVNNAIHSWARQGNQIHFITKGTHPDTEHFSVFEAQVPIDDRPETQYNLQLQNMLDKHDVIYIAGQARNFCVANSIKHLLNSAPEIGKKIVILDDCTSNIVGYEGVDDEIWNKAESLGVRLSTTDKEILLP